jgi:hypothetical protein
MLHDQVHAVLKEMDVTFHEHVDTHRPPSTLYPEGNNEVLDFALVTPPVYIVCEPEVKWSMPFYHKKLFLHGEAVRANVHFLLIPFGFKLASLRRFLDFVLAFLRDHPPDRAQTLTHMMSDMKAFLPSAQHNEPMFALPTFLYYLHRHLADAWTSELTAVRASCDPDATPYAIAYRDADYVGPIHITRQQTNGC